MRRARVLAALAACAPLLAVPARAAYAQRWSAAATVAEVRAHSTLPTARESLSGLGIGMEGAARFGRIVTRVRYLQADLSPSTTGTTAREAAEAELQLGARLTPWLALTTGPHVRSYRTALARQRWTRWDVRLVGELPLVPGVVTGYAEVTQTLAASVNVAEPWGTGHGGEAGMQVAPRHLPIWFRLAYRMDVAKLGDGTRREMVDGVTVSVGVRQ